MIFFIPMVTFMGQYEISFGFVLKIVSRLTSLLSMCRLGGGEGEALVEGGGGVPGPTPTPLQ